MSFSDMRPLFRIEPKMPAGGYKTYQLLAPKQTHFRPATCEEVECEPFLNGWTTVLDMALQPELVATVRTSGRPYRQVVDGTMVTFIFEPGVRCFRSASHVRSLEREPLYLVKGGDWRGNPRQIPVVKHVTPENWVDDFANHQDRLADHLERG